MNSRLEEIRSLARKIMGEEFSHGYPHVERVMGYAERIIAGEKLDADRELLTACILLHDTGRSMGEPHAYYSAVFAEGLLRRLGYSDDFIGKTVNCILYHSYSYSRLKKIKPMGVEARIVSDADKLDALGMIGFARLFSYSALHGRSIEETIMHVYDKLYRLPDLLHFETSRRIAGKLVERLRNSVESLLEELRIAGIDIDISITSYY